MNDMSNYPIRRLRSAHYLRERNFLFGTFISPISVWISLSSAFSISFLTRTLGASRLLSEFEVVRLIGLDGSTVESSEFLRFFGFRSISGLIDASDECLDDTTVGGGDKVKVGVGTCNDTTGNSDELVT